MKIKTSVTLSREVVALIDKHAEGVTDFVGRLSPPRTGELDSALGIALGIA